MAATKVYRNFKELLDVNFAGANDGDAAIFHSATGKMQPGTVSANLSTVPLLAPATDARNRYNGDIPGRLIVASGVLSDAAPRFTVQADGSLGWSDGTGAPDVRLGRAYAGALGLTGTLNVSQGVYVDSAGAGAKLYFGSAADVNLYRSAAGLIKTDGALEVNGTVGLAGIWIGANANPALRTIAPAAQAILGSRLLATDATTAFRFLGDGKHEWGPGGSTPTDTFLYRSSVGFLATDGHLVVKNALYVDNGGAGYSIYFGSGADTNLHRVSAGVLKTDGDLQIGGKITGNGSVPPGGSSGQVLSKTSGADYATAWTAAGSGAPATVTVTDWNTAVANGTYGSAPGVTNGPAGVNYLVGHVIQSHLGAAYARQVVYDLNSERSWQRRLDAGAWQPWTQLTSDGGGPLYHAAP